MQHMIFIDKEWARCGKCRNKLFKWTGQDKPHNIEIKCHSCKAINVCDKEQCRDCAYYHEGTCFNMDHENFSQPQEPYSTCSGWEYKNTII